MAISPQLPQLIATLRPGALQVLALQAGQVLDAQIIGPAPNGGTQVQIAGQLLNLVLPVAADAGTTIKLEVQAAGPQIKLALLPQPPPPQPAQVSQPQPLPSRPLSLPLEQSASPLPTATTASIDNSSPAPSNVSRSGQSPALPTAAPSQPLVNLPIGSLNTNPAVQSQPPVATQSQSAGTTLPAVATPSVWQNDPRQAPMLQGGAATIPGPVEAAPQAANPPVARPVTTPYAPSPSPQSPSKVPIPLPAAEIRQNTSATAPVFPSPQAGASSNAPAPASPQVALAHMVQSSLPRQDSVASLLAAISTIAGKVSVPEPVARAVDRVMAGRMPTEPDKLSGAVLRQAVLNSGIFQEALLVQGQVPAAQPDQKTALLQLRQALIGWLGPQSAMTPAGQIAPPIRGQVPRARATETPPINLGSEPEDIGKQVLERTEGALARLRLHQNASMPDPITKTGADWSMDLPVLMGAQQAVLHLQIHRDPEQQDQTPAERGWQMRFAINLPQLGEAGAQVSLRGGTTGVMLWAAERETSEALEAHVMALRQTLAEVGLRPGAVIVRHGEPTPAATASGRLLDAHT